MATDAAHFWNTAVSDAFVASAETSVEPDSFSTRQFARSKKLSEAAFFHQYIVSADAANAAIETDAARTPPCKAFVYLIV
jgi:hypothetical protein